MFSLFPRRLFVRKPRSGAAARRHVRPRRRIEPLEPRAMLSSVPFGAAVDDTAEFMLGDVTVTVVLMESNGQLDPSTEDWNPASIQEVKDRVESGLQWWVDTLDAQGTVHSLNFNIDYTYADNPVPTVYEPISRESSANLLWVDEFLDYAGAQTSQGISVDIRAFNHAQREAHDTNWAFTIFVVNSDVDADDRFASGGFRGAFGYAGGRYFVTPSKRAAGTFAHETGHIFWARDEYAGAGSYYDHRGYYNTQNLNALDDRPDDAPPILRSSIMYSTSGSTASPSAMEMIGWRDSDGNGVFDVLDVPHTLDGTGHFDPQTQTYHFSGSSSVGTLPNQNPSGLQNDITINEISRAQYRLDGGAWIDAAVYHTYTADLNLQIGPLPAFETIEIRTIDDSSQVASPVFTDHVDGPGETSWQNPADALDVNDDGSISPIDVLQIINDMNAAGSRLLPPRPVTSEVPPPYLDVNADGYVSPLDALQILNYLNARVGMAHQAQGEARPDDTDTVAATDLLFSESEPWRKSSREVGYDSEKVGYASAYREEVGCDSAHRESSRRWRYAEAYPTAPRARRGSPDPVAWPTAGLLHRLLSAAPLPPHGSISSAAARHFSSIG